VVSAARRFDNVDGFDVRRGQRGLCRWRSTNQSAGATMGPIPTGRAQPGGGLHSTLGFNSINVGFLTGRCKAQPFYPSLFSQGRRSRAPSPGNARNQAEK